MRTYLIFIVLVLAASCARAGSLVMSGATYWDMPFPGVVLTPGGEIFYLNSQFLQGGRMNVAPEDTIVFDLDDGTVDIHQWITPYEVISQNPEFFLFDPAYDVTVYSEATYSWDRSDDLNAVGAVSYVGGAYGKYLNLPANTGGGSSGSDADGDGIDDADDNCPVVFNPNQANADGDIAGDACDAFPNDPGETVDTDSDGIGNNADTDDDGDGIPDSWEIQNGLDPLDPTDALDDPDADLLSNLEEYLAGTDPRNPDTDGDTFLDGVDNCPTVSNVSQSDANGDGIGDLCEPMPLVSLADINGNGWPEIAVLVQRARSPNARTELISENSAFGADTITLDTFTGLRWLDVTLSTPFSYDEILVQLGAGGSFEGLRLATEAEVLTLWQNVGINTGNGFLGVFTLENFQPIVDLMAFVGVTGPNAGNLGGGNFFDYTLGHIESGPGGGGVFVTVASIDADPDPTVTGRPGFGGVPSNNPNNQHGSWLVSSNSPPVDRSTRVHIRDGKTDALISDIDFGLDVALQMVVLPDLNASGNPEIAMLNEQADGQVRVQIRDSFSGSIVKNIYYGLQYQPVSMTVVPDYSGNGVPEIAVLGSQAGTDAVRVQVRDAITGTFLDNVFLGTQSIAKDVVSVTDTSGNGIPELGILGVLKANDQVRMQMWDAQTSVFQSNVWFAKVYQPQSTITMPDINSNGSDEIVAMGVDPATQNIRVQVRDSLTTATHYNIWLGAVNKAVDIVLINDINNDGVADLAVLLETPGGTGRVRVQSGSDGMFIRNLFYTVVENPVGLAVMPDYNDSGFDELAVLGENAGVRHVQILDTSSGMQLNRIDFP